MRADRLNIQLSKPRARASLTALVREGTASLR
jgi:hypothetical protein